MKKIYMLGALVALFMVTGCTEDASLVPEADQVVIQGYIFANEPVEDIRITSTLALSSEDTIAPPINDAEVYLMKDGMRYDLQLKDEDGYYYYDGTDLTVEEGDVFEINVNCFGKNASGITQVPPPPKDVAMTSNTLYIPEAVYPGFEIDSTKHVLIINWTEDPSALFYVVMKNLETNPEPIEISGGGKFFGGKRGAFISAPSNMNKYIISFSNVSYYGRYSIKVYRVNKEYLDLYISKKQDSRDLNEPLTNIKNGLGVFSAFNSSIYLYFNVVPE
ncbi:DUF4249 family protein [bacterium]|nr:DUF4249 family protein [bacterium]